MWVADWFGWMNNKMGGDLEKIRTVGEYFIEVWKASGMDTSNVEFLWSKDVMKDEKYWKTVIQIARQATLQRVIRCSQIMGRAETDNLTAAQIFYPCMQATDIFHLNVDIAQLGIDQRKVNVLAREIGPKIGLGKPVAVHHHMLMGLTTPVAAETLDKADRTVALKMSKSNPDSAIFMDDVPEEVLRKISKAYCPEKQVHENPILEYCKYLVFEKFSSITIKRPAKFGGNKEICSYDELVQVYSQGLIHPLDLKTAVADYVNQILEPVQKKLSKGKGAKLAEQVRSFQVTR